MNNDCELLSTNNVLPTAVIGATAIYLTYKLQQML